MSFVVPNSAEVLMLKYILNMISTDGSPAPSGGDRLLRLYTNDLTPDENTDISDIVEMTGDGYAPVTLTGGGWTFASGQPTTALYSRQTFSFTTNVSINGYYITSLTDELLIVERLPTAPFLGLTLEIGPVVSLD